MDRAYTGDLLSFTINVSGEAGDAYSAVISDAQGGVEPMTVTFSAPNVTATLSADKSQRLSRGVAIIQITKTAPSGPSVVHTKRVLIIPAVREHIGGGSYGC